MQTDLQAKEKELLYKKSLLMNEVNKIDLELKKIQKELNTYVEPQTTPIKPKNNNDILSLLRSTDDEDDFIFASFPKPNKSEVTTSLPDVSKTKTNSQITAISDTLDEFTFLDVTYDIKKIEEILIKVCEILISKYPYKVAYFTKDSQLNTENINFSFNELDIKSQKHRLSNGMWVKINNDSDDVINISNKLLEICG